VSKFTKLACHEIVTGTAPDVDGLISIGFGSWSDVKQSGVIWIVDKDHIVAV
jgi:hypothetical protein